MYRFQLISQFESSYYIKGTYFTQTNFRGCYNLQTLIFSQGF